jgi:hypothetical protein
MRFATLRGRAIASLICAGAFAVGLAHADVTIQEQTSFDLSLMKAHGTTTELTSADKQRRDSALHCEGFMSIFCRNSQSAEITRLDREVRWMLEPSKKEYREVPFLTADQRRVAQEQMQANLEKLKQCPAARQNAAPAPDTQKCQMSPPKFDLVRTDTHASLVGHDARLTQVSMTESCTNPDTGDSCDFQIAMDAWLTQDEIAGLEDRRAFQKAYMHKLGLDDDALVQSQMRRYLAPYQESLKQLAVKAGDIKGFPLKSTVRIAFGGPHCAAAQQARSSGGGDTGASPSGTGLGAVATNLGSKLGGLFKKKQDSSADSSTASAPSPDSTGAPASAPPPVASPSLPAGMIQAAQFTTETQSITPGPIDPSQFEIPAGWKLITPEPSKKPDEVSCPSS